MFVKLVFSKSVEILRLKSITSVKNNNIVMSITLYHKTQLPCYSYIRILKQVLLLLKNNKVC